MIYNYDFYKEDGRWYIDFPQYIANGGQKADLLMVAGADKMLDVLSDNTERVTLDFSAQQMESDIVLKKFIGDPWGATYTTNSKKVKLVWLCNVTKVVMGKHPEVIYVKKYKKD